MIFFDIDETLFDNKSAQNFAALKLYYKFQDLQVIYEESAFPQKWNEVIEKYVQLFLVNKISFQQQRRNRLRKIFQKDFTNSEADDIFAIYLKFYEEIWQLFDDVIPCLNKLRPRKLGIISNGDKYQQRQKLRDLRSLSYLTILGFQNLIRKYSGMVVKKQTKTSLNAIMSGTIYTRMQRQHPKLG